MRRLLSLIAAVLLLDAAVTFLNIWPTPAITWRGDVSVELAVVLTLCAVFAQHRAASPVSDHGLPRRSPMGEGGTNDPRPSSDLRPPTSVRRPLSTALAAVWLLLAIGRYVDVTAPALWGRELNFYWDLRFLPDVAAMMVGASKRAVLLGAGATLAVVLVLGAVFLTLRWAFRTVLTSMQDGRTRVALGAASVLVVGLFALQVAGVFGLDLLGEPRRLFPVPVTQVYGRQAKLIAQALTGSHDLPASPNLERDLARVKDVDVFLFFIESYGAVTFENAELNARLQQPRAQFDAAIRETGRDVVSAFVESPTFGGSSWFAHITFLSGIRIGDPDANALLMTEQRPTVVTSFAKQGHRTFALMPGIWYPWPEGAFYGFQDVYDGPKLAYPGPSFGWWDMPDQFTLARLDEQEVDKTDRKPVFVFYPTVSTHTPFTPLAPYQPNWPRMLTPTPFDEAQLQQAYAGEPDYLNLRPAYGNAVAYAYETWAGYVRKRAGRDYVMIVIGDHQPPALVSGQGAPWDVPMHVITNRPEILASLRAKGFTSGLTPSRPHLGQMHEVVPTLLDAFSEQAPASASTPGPAPR